MTHANEALARKLWGTLTVALRKRDPDGHTPRDRMADGSVQLKAQSFDRPMVSGSREPSDPTGSQAVQTATSGDQAARDLAELDSKLKVARLAIKARDWRRACDALDRALDLVAVWSPKDPSSSARRATMSANAKLPGCSSCHRVPGPSGSPMWEPRHRGDLCRVCYNHQRRTGELPTIDELRQLHTLGESKIKCTHVVTKPGIR